MRLLIFWLPVGSSHTSPVLTKCCWTSSFGFGGCLRRLRLFWSNGKSQLSISSSMSA
ncbi:hypothetical protein PR003_g19145 [Phytophthora rubi]|uniref:Uncharacterized protein n=1 Tax=Phytophthora rubi TaxID=129364 RepID=A0A6A4E1T4_9STRA|nr:hypothetical protein PR001_g17723 [Phytophthora rubi]KAE9314817.1 hypothetical protein PR003_g19145 [Phytophthora rubi]